MKILKSKNLEPAGKLVERFVMKGKIPGASVAYVTENDVQTFRCGMSSVVNGPIALKEDAVYDLASLTKVVCTTTLALQCLETGVFSLKTGVKSILPDFPYDNVTVGQLMTHTSGICHDDKAYRNLACQEELRKFFFSKPLEFVPGSRVVYSDFGYITLGYVIEKAAGRLDRLFSSQVAEPLDMCDTGFCPGDRGLTGRCVPTEVTKERGVIQGEVHDGKAYMMGGISGNSGLFSTLEDLTGFVQMMLGRGTGHGRRILKESTVDLLKVCRTEGLNERRTLGWWCDEPSMSFGDYYSGTCLYHTGFTGTSIYIDYCRNCGIVILTNRIHPTRENDTIMELRNRLHNVILAE